jgi:hypothetical protein
VPISSSTMFSIGFPVLIAVFVQVLVFLKLDLRSYNGRCLPRTPSWFSPTFQLHDATGCISFHPPRARAWLSCVGRWFSCAGARSLFLLCPARCRRCCFFGFFCCLFIFNFFVFLCYLVYELVLVSLYYAVPVLDSNNAFTSLASFLWLSLFRCGGTDRLTLFCASLVFITV